MNEWGKVVTLKGKIAVLSIQKSEECEKCRKCRPGRGENEMILEAKNKVNAQIGDTVEVSDHISSPLVQAFVQLGIPLTDGLIGGMIGYILSRAFHQTNRIAVWVIAVGIISMLFSYVISRKLLVSIRHFKAHKFIVSSIIHKEG